MRRRTGERRFVFRGPFSIPNVRYFLFFRLFFNARFYYPVFTILFLDFGLTLPQFAVLNAVWAVTIVMLEVPSGALADTLGRKKLLVASSALMTLEMGVLLLAPRGNPGLLFAFFVANRVLSGAAEAAASGADEALAFDSLRAQGEEEEWGRVLQAAMRTQSTGFMVTMTLGAAVYDPEMMGWLLEALNLPFTVTQATTLRFPVALTFVMALLALFTTLRMREAPPPEAADAECREGKGCARSILDALRLTLGAGKWILKTPFAMAVIAAGFLFDSLLRTLVTLTSQYFRLIRFPEASFGLIGSFLSLLGLFIPAIALRLTRGRTPEFNMVLTAGVILLGLAAMPLFLPYAGLIPVAALFSALFMTSFFVSHYLNRITPSRHRATVLSFKGLAFNLAYGCVGLLYAFLLSGLRETIQESGLFLHEEALKNAVFMKSMIYFPLFFITAGIGYALWARHALRKTTDPRTLG